MARFAVPRPIGDRYFDAFMPVPQAVDGDATVAGLRGAVMQLRTGWQQAYEHDERRRADQTMLPTQRLLASADFAKKRREVDTSLYARALEAAEREIEDLAGKLRSYTARPAAAGDAQIHAEIRSMVRTLPDDQRARTISTAIADGTWDLPKAVLSAPGALSGLTPPVLARLRDEYLSMAAPGDHARHKVLSEARDVAKRAFENYEDHHAKLLDWTAVEDLEAGRVVEAAE